MTDDATPKRKLALMPELLPDPRHAKRDRDSRPRERTIEHMKRLLALTASAGAFAACSKGYAVVDPLPMPATTIGRPDAGPGAVLDAETPFGPFGPVADAATLGTMDDDAGADSTDAGAKKKKTVVSTVPTRGYMVVDPLPPPTSLTNPKRNKP